MSMLPEAPTIPKSLLRRPFSGKMAKEYHVSYSKIRRLLQKGFLERLERGVYQSSQVGGHRLDVEEAFRVATIRIGAPCAISYLSALEYYHLTDEISSQIWLIVPSTKRSTHPDFRLVRVSKPHWNIGIDKHSGFWITSLERTLVDVLANPNYLGKMLGVEALKQAISEQKTSFEKVTQMASRLGVFKRIQPIIEILA